MRLPRKPDAAILSALLLPILAIAADPYECDNIAVGDHQWNLKELGGPKSVLQSEPLASGFRNTTYTIDICKSLKSENKEVLCPEGSRVCAVERDISNDGTDALMDSWPLAGDLKEAGGNDLDAKWESLPESDSKTDSEKDGLLLSMSGGIHKVQDRPQKVVVKFICDKTKVGDENIFVPEDKYTKVKRAEGEDTEKPKETDPASVSSLKFVKYDKSGSDADILSLEWRTKFACRDAKDEKEQPKTNNSWGFFTWFIIIAFLSTATYLIFGSWLNYNRYGARGWDLLPHGDTIRDAPYLLKDWMRRVMSTIQGGGSRGGYAAV